MTGAQPGPPTSRGTPQAPSSGRAPRRGSRARTTRTASPPPPHLPQTLIRIALVIAFMTVAWLIFSQVNPTEPGADESDEPAEATQPPTSSLAPAVRIVGEWRYVLDDDENLRRTEAQKSIDAGADDSISRVMISQLNLSLRDSLKVGKTSLTITRGEKQETGTWEAVEQGPDSLTLVFESESRGSLRGAATFTGGDWMSLGLQTATGTQVLRWKRVKPALPSEPPAPQTPPAETP
jgi:hypothetical protein